VGKIEGDRTLGRPRRRWDDNNKIDFRKREGEKYGIIWLRLGTGGWFL
jgi:hypothetical protein